MEKHWSKFHSAGQDGFQDLKEDFVDDIRARVRKYYPHAKMETLQRMSRRDLSDLMFALQDAVTSIRPLARWIAS
jgi:hypothetical protein